MVNMKKLISGALVVLIGLMSFSVAFATPSATGDFDVTSDTTALTIAHGQTVSGTLTIDNTLIAAGSNGDPTFDLSATGASGAALPSEFEVKFYEAGTDITVYTSSGVSTNSGITSSVAVADTPLEITYTISVASGTAPTVAPHQTVEITVTETGSTSTPANAVTFSRIVDIPSDDTRVITQDSVVSTVARESSVEITVALDNTGNENVIVSTDLESLSTGSNTYFALGALTLNWDNGRTLSTTGATVAPETGGSNTITPTNSQNFVITVPTALADRYGVYTGTLSLMDNSITPVSKDTSALTINIVDSNNEVGLKINDGTNDGEFNDISADDARTYPGDKIELIDVTINNEVGKDLENVFVTISIFNQVDGDKIINEFESSYFDINDNRDDQFDYAFQLPFDITEGTYVIEYDVEAEDVDGNVSTALAYDTFTVDQDIDHLVVEDITYSEQCAGETSTVSVKIANIGTSRMDETDDIQVRLYIGNFEFDETINWNTDFRVEDSELFTFNVDIPADATSSNLMDVSVFHDRDTDSGDDGATSSTMYELSTANCTEAASTDVHGIVTGTSVAEGTVGSPTQYTLTVMNTGSTDATYTLEVSGISGWGTSQIEPAGAVSVSAGATSTVYVYLTPSDNAAGSNAAVLTLKSGANVIQTKTLTMNVAEASISTYTNALLGSSIADFGVSQQSLITLLSLATILFVTVGTLYTATQPAKKKKRTTKKERK